MQNSKRTPETKRLSELSLHQNHARILAGKYSTAIPYLYSSVMLLRRQIIALHVVGSLLIIASVLSLDMFWSGLIGVGLCLLEAGGRAIRFKHQKRLVLVLLKRHRACLSIDQAAVQFKKAGFVSSEVLKEIKWLLTCNSENK